jgi:hypothetical protein
MKLNNYHVAMDVALLVERYHWHGEMAKNSNL